MAAACGSSSCPSAHAPKSKLLRKSEAQYGFVPKLSHHEWQNSKNLFCSRSHNNHYVYLVLN